MLIDAVEQLAAELNAKTDWLPPFDDWAAEQYAKPYAMPVSLEARKITKRFVKIMPGVPRLVDQNENDCSKYTRYDIIVAFGTILETKPTDDCLVADNDELKALVNFSEQMFTTLCKTEIAAGDFPKPEFDSPGLYPLFDLDMLKQNCIFLSLIGVNYECWI